MKTILDFIFHAQKCVSCKGWYDKRSMKSVPNNFSGKWCELCQHNYDMVFFLKENQN